MRVIGILWKRRSLDTKILLSCVVRPNIRTSVKNSSGLLRNSSGYHLANSPQLILRKVQMSGHRQV